MQRWRTMRAEQDSGAVAVLVALLLTSVLLGMTAFVVDVGSLYGERRQLQNSADAGALSLAQDCAAQTTPAACTTSGASIADLVDENDRSDGTTKIAGICIRPGSYPAFPCGAGSGLAACLPVPAGLDHYVEVYTSTLTDSGDTLLPPEIAGAVVDGYSGTNVGACSRVAWGGPGGDSTIPLTISKCEFNYYVGDPPSYGPQPPYPPITAAPWPYSGVEHVITFHNTAGNVASCAPGPAGSDDPISGGFGWLQSTNCDVTTDIAGWFDATPGTSPGSDCRAADFAASYGQLVHIPIYDGTNGLNGANGKYHMEGYAAFVLTGYRFASAGQKKSLITGSLPCTPPSQCISGFFTQDPDPTGGSIGGPSMGVTVIQMAG